MLSRVLYIEAPIQGKDGEEDRTRSGKTRVKKAMESVGLKEDVLGRTE